jgi:hypothetical protein
MTRKLGISVFSFWVGIGTLAHAQEAPLVTPDPEKTAGEAQTKTQAAELAGSSVEEATQVRSDALRSDAKANVTVDASKVALEEKTRNTESMLSEQRGNLQVVSSHLREARERRDIVQVNCVGDKLTSVKGLLRISEIASIRMFEAIGNDQPGEINHNYSQVAVAHQRSQLAKSEADVCVGAESSYNGKTDVKVDIDSDVPESNPSLAAFQKFSPGLMPPIASDF